VVPRLPKTSSTERRQYGVNEYNQYQQQQQQQQQQEQHQFINQ